MRQCGGARVDQAWLDTGHPALIILEGRTDTSGLLLNRPGCHVPALWGDSNIDTKHPGLEA